MKHLLVILSLLALAVACGNGTNDRVSRASGFGEHSLGTIDSVYPGDFNLHPEPRSELESGCDAHVRLALVNGYTGPMAVVESARAVGCDPLPADDSRGYDLKVEMLECGSLRYSGKHKGHDGNAHIEIIDHRARRCRDIKPAQLIMTETWSDGRRATLYGAAH